MCGVILVTYFLSVHDAHCQRAVPNQTPLTEAVLLWDTGRVRRALAGGADVNATNGAGFTALMLAAMKAQDQTVDILLAEGADPNLEALPHGWTALRQAASSGNPKIIKSLLKAGARLDAKDRNGWTPIVIAAMAAKAENVKALSDAGAQLKMDLVFASALGQLDQVKTLSGATDINAKNDTGRTPLVAAAANNQVEVVKFLLSKGANPDSESVARSPWGPETMTALALAAVEGHLGVVKALVEKGADLSKKTPTGWTPLLLAIVYHNLDVVQFLLDKKVDPNQKAPEDRLVGSLPALSVAAVERQAAIMKRLIQAGANINATNQQGMTALMVSAIAADERGMATLLSAGAKVGLKDEGGNTALQIAEHQSETKELLGRLIENPDMARKMAAEPDALDSATMKMADFKKAVSPFTANNLGKGRSVTKEDFEGRFGHPRSTEQFDGQALWYYGCSDGIIRLVVEASVIEQQGVVIKDVNE
jgi:ankyrin repeat protein